MADMFNVQVPAWLTEITTSDPNKGGRQALQIGADIVQRNRQLQIQQELGEKRIEAQRLMYEGRLQSLDQANSLAQIRLESSQQQLELQRQRFEANQAVINRKFADYSGFARDYSSSELTADDRREIDAPNPRWTDPATPPTVDQSSILKRLLESRRAEKLKSEGLVAAETTVGPKGETTQYRPDPSLKLGYDIIEVMPGVYELQNRRTGKIEQIKPTAVEAESLKKADFDYRNAVRQFYKVQNDPLIKEADRSVARAHMDTMEKVLEDTKSKLKRTMPGQQPIAPANSQPTAPNSDPLNLFK